MAGRAADPLEDALAVEHRALDVRIARNHAARHLQRRLPDDDRGDVGAGHLVREAVAVRIGVAAEALGRLDAVMMVERGVA